MVPQSFLLPFLYGVYISQLIRFEGVSSQVNDFKNQNKGLSAKFLKHGYRYHKLHKAFCFKFVSPILRID